MSDETKSQPEPERGEGRAPQEPAQPQQQPAPDQASPAELLQEIFEAVSWQDTGENKPVRAWTAGSAPGTTAEPPVAQPPRDPYRRPPPAEGEEPREDGPAPSDQPAGPPASLDQKLEALAHSIREGLIRLLREVRASSQGELSARVEVLTAGIMSLAGKLEAERAKITAIPGAVKRLSNDLEQMGASLEAISARQVVDQSRAEELETRLEESLEAMRSTVDTALGGAKGEGGEPVTVAEAVNQLQGQMDTLANAVSNLIGGLRTDRTLTRAIPESLDQVRDTIGILRSELGSVSGALDRVAGRLRPEAGDESTLPQSLASLRTELQQEREQDRIRATAIPKAFDRLRLDIAQLLSALGQLDSRVTGAVEDVMTGLNASMAGVGTDVTAAVSDARTELNAAISELGTGVTGAVAEVGQRLDEDRQRASAATEAQAQLRSQLDALSESLTALSGATDADREVVRSLPDLVAELRTELATDRAQERAKAAAVPRAFAQLRRDIERVATGLEGLQAEMAGGQAEGIGTAIGELRDELSRDRDGLGSSLVELQTSVAAALGELRADLAREREEERTRAAAIPRAYDQLRGGIERLHNALGALTARLDEMGGPRIDPTGALEALREQVAAISEPVAVPEQLAALPAAVEALRGRIESLPDAVRGQVGGLPQIVDSLREQVATLAGVPEALERLRGELDEDRMRANAVPEAIAQVRGEMGRLDSTVAALSGKLEDDRALAALPEVVRAEVGRLPEMVEAVRQQMVTVSAVPEALERLRRELDEDRKRANAVPESIAHLRSEMGRLDAAVAALSGKIDDDRGLAALPQSVGDTRGEVARLADALVDLRTELEAERARVAALPRAFERLGEELRGIQEGIRALDERVGGIEIPASEPAGTPADAGRAAAPLRGELRRIREEVLAAVEAARTGMAAEIPEAVGALRTQVDRIAETVGALSESVDEQRDRADALPRAVEELRRELAETRARAAVTREAISKLRGELEATRQETADALSGVSRESSEAFSDMRRKLATLLDRQRALSEELGTIGGRIDGGRSGARAPAEEMWQEPG